MHVWSIDYFMYRWDEYAISYRYILLTTINMHFDDIFQHPNDVIILN